MAFRFSLEPILKLRKAQERAEALKLDAIILEQRRTRTQLDALREASVHSQRQIQQQLEETLTGSELQFQDACRSGSIQRREYLGLRLAGLEKERLAQLQVLCRGRQRREMLETLREQQLHDYTQRLARREQQECDDLFLSKQEITTADR